MEHLLLERSIICENNLMTSAYLMLRSMQWSQYCDKEMMNVGLSIGPTEDVSEF